MSLATLRTRLIEHLVPPDGWSADTAPVRSDFDLNPDARLSGRTLRPAAVLIPVIARPEGATVLMTRRSDNLASHTGQIAFPGGGSIRVRLRSKPPCEKPGRKSHSIPPWSRCWG